MAIQFQERRSGLSPPQTGQSKGYQALQVQEEGTYMSRGHGCFSW